MDIAAQRYIPLGRLLTLQLLVVFGALAGFYLGGAGWQGGLVGAALAMVAVTPVHGTTLPQAIALRWDFARRRRRRASNQVQPGPFNVAVSDNLQIGFHWDGTHLLSVIHVEADPLGLTIMEPGVTVSGEMVPMHALVDCLHQFDITLDSIDVISHGSRSHGHTDLAAVYDAVLGPLPAIAQRSVWVAVRFDPTQCADAIQRRGGGREGILRTATTATRRVANRLTEAGLRPQILPANGIAAATNHLSDGANVATIDEQWDMCRDGQFRLCSFAVEPELLTTQGLGLMWTVPSYSTTVCLSLRDAPQDGLIRLRGLVRFNSGVDIPTQLPGLIHLPGRQYSALTASLPVHRSSRPVGHWVYGERDTELHGLAVPASGCGQVIGADDQGRAVALPLFGAPITRVEICGTLHLAQQVVLRSLALGARVLVHSRRSALWRDMVEQVGQHDLLWVADFNRHAIQAGAERNFTVEMFDAVTEQSVRVGVTKMVVAPPGTPVSENADVALELISLENDTVRVSTQAGVALVTMVATDEEMGYIKTSANMVD